jgi:hypothetical protein
MKSPSSSFDLAAEFDDFLFAPIGPFADATAGLRQITTMAN